MESVNYVISLINDKNEIVVDDDFKFRIAITKINNDPKLTAAFKQALAELVKIQ